MSSHRIAEHLVDFVLDTKASDARQKKQLEIIRRVGVPIAEAYDDAIQTADLDTMMEIDRIVMSVLVCLAVGTTPPPHRGLRRQWLREQIDKMGDWVEKNPPGQQRP